MWSRSQSVAMKRRADQMHNNNVKVISAGRNSSNCYFFVKFLVDPHMGTCIIGKGGEIISNIIKTTGALVKISGRQETYPGTQMQSLVLGGETIEQMMEAFEACMEKIAQNAAEQVELGMAVPRITAGKIIGTGGENVKKLRELGSRVSVESTTNWIDKGVGEQAVMLFGSMDQVAEVVRKIIPYVQEENSEPWFQKWGGCWLVDDEYSRVPPSGGRGDRGNHHGDRGDRGSRMPMPDMVGMMAGGCDMYGGGGAHGAGAPHIPGKDGRLVESLLTLFQSKPSVAEQNMCIELTLRNEDVGAVMGRGASILKEIQQRSGAKMSFSNVESEGDGRKLTITGPPMSVYLGHFMAMTRVVENMEMMEKSASPGRQMNDDTLAQIANDPETMAKLMKMMSRSH